MKHILLIICTITLLISCDVDLDQGTVLAPAPDAITAEQSLYAAYGFLQAATNEEYYFGAIRSEIGWVGSGETPYSYFDDFDSNLTTASDQIIQPYWFNLYRTILATNLSIERGTGQDAAEAKFLRGYCYFKLVQVFGDVPINTASEVSFETNDAFVRNSVSEIYDLIISDLTDAIAGLEVTKRDGRGRPSSYSAKAMLAKVYMTIGQPLLAEPMLLDVINNSGATIEPSYEVLFSDAGESSNEILFSVQYSATGDTYSNIFTNETTGDFSKIIFPVEQNLRDSYEDGDLREAVTTDTEGRALKHFSDNGSTTSSEADWIVLRLADVVLMYAEAALMNGALSGDEVYALPEIIQIRDRAGLGALSGDDALQVIKDERKIELAWEGHRWFDLVRWGDAKSTLGFTDDNYLLFPIPISEVLATSGTLSQNPGY